MATYAGSVAWVLCAATKIDDRLDDKKRGPPGPLIDYFSLTEHPMVGSDQR